MNAIRLALTAAIIMLMTALWLHDDWFAVSFALPIVVASLDPWFFLEKITIGTILPAVALAFVWLWPLGVDE